MKVYVVNVNNCQAYSDYYEGNRGVYATLDAALADLKAMGFDPESRRRLIPYAGMEDDPDWYDFGFYDVEEYRIEEWEVVG